MRIQYTLSDSFNSNPIVAVIGTWDPMVDAHRDLFRRLASEGCRRGLTPVAVFLYPSPSKLVNRNPGCGLEYTDIRARVIQVRESFGVSPLVVRLKTSDLDSSCRSFFDLLATEVTLRELWLGANQSLGRGPQGSDAAISALATRRRISLRRMDPCPSSSIGGRAFRLIAEGKLKKATRCVGNPPVWGRPISDRLRLDWPPGTYHAIALGGPTIRSPKLTDAIPLHLSTTKGAHKRTLLWPSKDIEWLAFVSGPSDQ